MNPRVQPSMKLVTALLLVASAHTVGAQNTASISDINLSRIRRGLAARALILPTMRPQATFRVDIDEKRPDLRLPPDPRDYSAGPIPPGGMYAFELRRQMGNPWLGQPLFKFNLLPVAQRAAGAIGARRTADDERAAREQVTRELRAFCIANQCEVSEVSRPPAR